MNFPSDLPHMIEYRCGSTVRTTLPRHAVRSISTSGKTDAAVTCPQVPYGATDWRIAGEQDWKPLGTWPRSWEPFLNRPRPSEMDFRPKVELREVPNAIQEVE